MVSEHSKLVVAFIGIVLCAVVSIAGLALSWLTWKTAIWFVACLGSIWGLSYVNVLRKVRA